jgi:uncharacterized protein (DUF1501 family)
MTKKNSCSCSRRSFLRGSGMALAGLGAHSLLPSAFMRHAMASTGSGGDQRFMFIFLRGGNDGINTIIPHGDPDYSLANRPDLYIAPADAIDLNGFASFHPALADLMDGFNAGDLAAIHRVGYPNASRSHFDGQRIWENGNPLQAALLEGWLGRYMQENGLSVGADLPALTVQGASPVILRGEKEFVNIADPNNFDILSFLASPLPDKYRAAWLQQYGRVDPQQAYGAALSQTGVNQLSTLDEYASWDQANWDPKDPDNPTWSLFPVSAATNPADPSGPGGLKFAAGSYDFFNALKVCALAMLESDPLSSNNCTRVAGTELQGFDLHTSQGGMAGRHAELLSWLGYGMRSLRIALSGAAVNEPRGYSSIWDKTVVSTLSEFGRTTLGNGSAGTDHGKASCMFMAGGPVTGGIYNCDPGTWPAGVSLGIDGRFLAEQTDFRSIFWEVLRDHMGAPPAQVETHFPGYTAGGLAAQELGLIT